MRRRHLAGMHMGDMAHDTVHDVAYDPASGDDEACMVARFQRRQWLRAAMPAALLPMSMSWAIVPTSVRAQTSDGRDDGDDDKAHPSLRIDQPLRFPQDHGAHPAARTEWWYITGELDPAGPGEQPLGFQITFFRSRVDVALANPSQFSARQIVAAHAALSDAQRGHLKHDQRIARAGFGLVDAAEGDTKLTLRDWTLSRGGPTGQGVYQAHIPGRDFLLDLRFVQTQAPLLQGQQGFSRKSPSAAHATRYYSMPHLKVEGHINHRRKGQAVTGRAWLDHEWGETILSPDSVGWDWFGMNLHDGGALMVFRTRRRDSSVVWHGGSLRRPRQPDRVFASSEIRMVPGETWQSPATGAKYPVAWTLHIAGDVYTARARMPNQELDGRHSTGSIYWEGLCDLRDGQGRPIGKGYLEMTGYATPMSL